MKTVFRSRRQRRGLAGLLAVALATTGLLQFSSPPSQAGVAGPSLGAFLVTYGRRSATEVETAWASRGLVEITRTSRGNYTLTASQITGAGNAQVTVLGPGAPLPLCNVTSTSVSSAGTKVKVRCWSAVTGKTADAGFSLFYNTGRFTLAGNHYAVLSTNKTNRSHTPTNQFRAAPSAAPLTVTRLARGAYKVTFPNENFPSNGAIMFVSAIGSSPRYCNLAGWLPDGSDVIARVDCYTRSGARSDSLFSLVATEGSLTGDTGPGGGLSVWRDYGAFTSTPATFGPNDYHWNGNGGSDSSRNEYQPGRSTVVGDNVVTGPAIVFAMVSSYGFNFVWPEDPAHESTANRCAPGLVSTDLGTGDATFEVQCYTPSGYPVDASYTLGAVLISAVL